MVTKAYIRDVNRASNTCTIRVPLFETASSTEPIILEAVMCIAPGLYNNLYVDDVVFIAFEENALEKPVIIGKLFVGAGEERATNGGAGVFDSLVVRTSATIPASTTFEYPLRDVRTYANFSSPKKLADYLRWLEATVKKLWNTIEENFNCFRKWTQWQLQPENVEIDDGDLDSDPKSPERFIGQYQPEDQKCEVCGKNCPKRNVRSYKKLATDMTYPNL